MRFLSIWVNYMCCIIRICIFAIHVQYAKKMVKGNNLHISLINAFVAYSQDSFLV